MAPIIGFRTTSERDAIKAIRPAAVIGADEAVCAASSTPSRTADYIYRIAALTAGLALLATVV